MERAGTGGIDVGHHLLRPAPCPGGYLGASPELAAGASCGCLLPGGCGGAGKATSHLGDGPHRGRYARPIPWPGAARPGGHRLCPGGDGAVGRPRGSGGRRPGGGGVGEGPGGGRPSGRGTGKGSGGSCPAAGPAGRRDRAGRSCCLRYRLRRCRQCTSRIC